MVLLLLPLDIFLAERMGRDVLEISKAKPLKCLVAIYISWPNCLGLLIFETFRSSASIVKILGKF